MNADNVFTTEIPQPAGKDLSIETGKFTTLELDKAIESIKLNKAPGMDSCMNSDVLKNGGPTIKTQILHICNAVYQSGVAPIQWTNNIIVPVPKKGDLQLMKNYRGISLMSLAAKLYNRLILNRH